MIAAENLAFLTELSPEGQEGQVGLYHASPRDPVWEYVLSSPARQSSAWTRRASACA